MTNQNFSGFFDDDNSNKEGSDDKPGNSLSGFFDAPKKAAPAKKSGGRYLTEERFRQLAREEGAEHILPTALSIFVQESGGGRTTATSIDGARSVMQVMPATFKRMAKPGEHIDNVEDNARAGLRYLKHISKYANTTDPARLAVGYFSGEGNVNKDPNGTPWRQDRKDGNGKTVSGYAADVVRRMGGKTQGAATPQQAQRKVMPLSQVPKWADIVAKPEYAKLTPEQKLETKQAYFDHFVAPHAGAQAAALRSEFLAYTKNDEPSLFTRAKNTAGEIGGAVKNLIDHGTTGPASVLTGRTMPEPEVTANTSFAPVKPEVRAQFNAAWDAATPEARAKMQAAPGWQGQLARDRAGKDAIIDTRQDMTGGGVLNPVQQHSPLDTRAEARTAFISHRGEDPAFARRAAVEGAARGVPLGLEVDAVQKQYGTAQPSTFDFETANRFAPSAESNGFNNPIARGMAKGVSGLSKAVYGINEFVADTVGADEYAAWARGKAGGLRGFEQAIGERGTYLERNLEGAINSITQQIPAMAMGIATGGTAAIPLGAMGVQSFGQEYSDGRAAGQSVGDAVQRAAAFAALEVLGEKFGLGDQIAAIKGAIKGMPSDQIMGFVMRAFAKEVPGEILTTSGQFAIDKIPGGVGLNPNAGVGDYFKQVADTIVQTVMQTGVMAGGTTGLSTAVRYARNANKSDLSGLQPAAPALGDIGQPQPQQEPPAAPPAAPAPEEAAAPAAPAPVDPIAQPDAVVESADAVVADLAQQAGVPLETVLPNRTSRRTAGEDALLKMIEARRRQLTEKRDGTLETTFTDGGAKDSEKPGRALSPVEKTELAAIEAKDMGTLRRMYGLDRQQAPEQMQAPEQAPLVPEQPEPTLADRSTEELEQQRHNARAPEVRNAISQELQRRREAAKEQDATQPEQVPAQDQAPEGSQGQAPAEEVAQPATATKTGVNEVGETFEIPAEYEDLFDEQGRPVFSRNAGFKAVKERHGLDHAGVRRVQQAIMNGEAPDLDAIKRQSEAEAAERKARAEYANSHEGVAESSKKEAEKAKEKDEQRKAYFDEATGGKLADGEYETETGLRYTVSTVRDDILGVTRQLIKQVDDDGEVTGIAGAVENGQPDAGAVEFVSGLKDGYLRKAGKPVAAAAQAAPAPAAEPVAPKTEREAREQRRKTESRTGTDAGNAKPAGVNHADDFAIRPVEITEHLISTGNIKALYKAAGVKTADAFSDLPLEQRSKAYAKYVADGGKPAPTATEAYNDKVARQEREALIRRLQSDATVRQTNGKPFKTEASAKEFSTRHELDDTHEVAKVEAGFVLKRLPEAWRPSVLKAMAERQANEAVTQAVAASKQDLEHLFGVDKKREKALDRIKRGTAYFGTEKKAKEFITQNGLKDTHEVKQSEAGTRWDVVAKQGQEGGKQDAAVKLANATAPEHVQTGATDQELGSMFDEVLAEEVAKDKAAEKPKTEKAANELREHEPMFSQATKLMEEQKAATGNPKAEAAVRRKVRALAKKVPQDHARTVAAFDITATRLNMGTLQFAEQAQDEPKTEKAARARKQAAAPRAMTHEGQTADGKPIMPGDVFQTSSGRVTTPYPKQKSVKYATQWLIDNAVAEARARGDNFNATMFSAEAPGKGGFLPPASVDSMNEYLFGQQPAVVRSILRPLVDPAQSAAEPPKTEREAKAQRTAAEAATVTQEAQKGNELEAELRKAKERMRRALKEKGEESTEYKAAEARVRKMRRGIFDAEEALPAAMDGDIQAIDRIAELGFGLTAEGMRNTERETKTKRTAAEAAMSAAKNTAAGLEAAINGLGELFGGSGKLNSGLAFDEQTYAKAKPLFQQAISHMGEAGKDMKEAMRAVVRMVLDKFGPETANNMKPYVVRFIKDVAEQADQENNANTAPTQGERNESQVPEDGQRPLEQAPAANGGKTEAGGDTSGSPAGSSAERNGQGAGADEAGVQAPRSRGSRTRRISDPATRQKRVGGRRRVDADGAGVPGQQQDLIGAAAEDASAPNIPAANFKIESDISLGEGGEVTKFNDNIAAITTLKAIEAEQRRATPEEQRILARFVGWGGLASAFPNPETKEFKKGWEARGKQLQELLTPAEYRAASNSTRNAHYTSSVVVKAMWEAAHRLGYRGGLALESSMGIGNFIGLMPEKTASRFIGVEYDSLTARMAAALYPQATVLKSGFQHVPIPDDAFDLAIGNPPFGNESLRFQYRPELNGDSIHNQFFRASLASLKPGGLMIQVVSRYLMDKKDTSSRVALAREAELVASIRLPDNAFKENARTSVVTDIVILRKRTAADKAHMDVILDAFTGRAEKAADKERARLDLAAQAPDWIGTTSVKDPLGGADMVVNNYFAKNPHQIIGTMERSGSMQHADDLTVRLDDVKELESRLAEAMNRLPADIVSNADVTNDAIERAYSMLGEHLGMVVAQEEVGHIKINEDGQLTRALDLDFGNGQLMTRQVLSPDSPWSNQLMLDEQKRWYKLVVKTDAEGKPVKALNSSGEATRLNVFERVVYENEADVPNTLRLGATGYAKLKAVVGLRDLLKKQLSLEADDAAADAMEGNRKRLDEAYDAFVKEYGPINRPANARLIADMPDAGLVFALESNYEPARTAAQAAKTGLPEQDEMVAKAAILSVRVVLKYEPPTKAATAADALAINLAERGVVDMERIASLLGTTPEKAQAELTAGDNPLVFLDPETNTFETANAYLSGPVRRKLLAAMAAGMQSNIKALDAVQPAGWGSENVSVQVGATWVPTDIYADFLRHLVGGDVSVLFSQATNTFSVNLKNSDRTKMDAWSSEEAPGSWIFGRMLNSQTPTVTRKDTDGSTYVDKDLTSLAILKSREISNEFQEWIFNDAERRERLVEIFNEKFNTRVTRQYDGSHLELPGKVPDSIIKLRLHQLNAIWRGICSRFLLIDHAVGAGKTYTGIARAMERRRMGLARKPAIVVPNHLVEQWEADVYKLYPGAKVLAASKADFEKKNRRKLFGKIATGDYDIVILPHSSLIKIGIAPETEQRYLEQELDEALAAVRDAEEQAKQDGDTGYRKPIGVKEAERLVTRIQNRMDKLRERATDRLLTFEQLGIDDLTVDEAHEFKNLFYSSRLSKVRGMGDKMGSARAADLYNKVRVLRDSGGAVVFMTGTPVSNSVVELYTMMRYLASNELREAGIEHFDAWRTQFVGAEPAFEPDETNRLKEVTRLGRSWSNMRSLMDLYYQFTDAVSLDDIKRSYFEEYGKEFPVPKVKGGDRQLIKTELTPEQADMLEQVIAGFDGLDGISDHRDRNKARLRLMDRARKLSLDVRASVPGSTSKEEGGKLERVSTEIKRIYDKWSDDKGTQLVFLDRSVPKAKGDDKIIKAYDDLIAKREKALAEDDDAKYRRINDALEQYDHNEIEELRAAQNGGWNAYQQIKDNLVAAGIPAGEIRFIQEANTDEQKQALFNAVKGGKVRVLIGSTPRMGAGTNVQDRLVALHHVDVTWKPSDIEQREGRIIRQGNELLKKYGQDNFEVEVLAYATERTVDAKMWSLNATKLKAINGLRKYTGDFTMDIEDEESVSMAEMAALASGNPLLLERVSLESKINALELQEKAFRRKKFGAEDSLRAAEKVIDNHPAEIEKLRTQAVVLAEKVGKVREAAEQRSVKIEGTSYTTYKDALKAALDSVAKQQAGNENARYAVNIDGELVTNKAGIDDAVGKALGDDSPFEVTIDGTIYTQRTRAGRDLSAILSPKAQERGGRNEGKVGKMFGYDLIYQFSGNRFNTNQVDLVLALEENGRTIASDDLTGHDPGIKFTTAQLRDMLSNIANRVVSNSTGVSADYLQRQLDTAIRDLETLRARSKETFGKADELKEHRKRLTEVVAELSGAGTGTETQADAPLDADDTDTTGKYNVEAPRAKYTDDKNLQLFLDYGPDESQSGPRGVAAQREAVSGVDDLRSTENVLALALSRDYAARQRVNLVGQKVGSAEDLAILAQVYRDPRFETFRLVFVNDSGAVVSQIGLTSRLPASAVGIVGNDIGAYMKAISTTARNHGATGFYMLHNHPSGMAEASQADKRMTREFAMQLDKNGLAFKSHVVIDTNEYSTIDRHGVSAKFQKDFGQPAVYRDAEWENAKVGSPDALMIYAKRVQAERDAITLIHTDSQFNVKAISTIPVSAVSNKASARRNIIKASLKTQGSQVFAVSRNHDALMKIGAIVQDGVHIDEKGNVKSLRQEGLVLGGQPFPSERRARVTMDSSKEFAYLREWSSQQPAQMRKWSSQQPEQKVAEPVADYSTRTPRSMMERAQRNMMHFFGNSQKLRTFGAYHKSLSTQYHKALKDKHFGKVFNLINAMQNHVSMAAIRPAELAPGVLPRVDDVRSAARGMRGKGRVQMEKVSRAIFEGTLAGGGDQVMMGTVWSDDQLRERFDLDDAGIGLYRQARYAINTSIDELAAAEAYALAQNIVPKSVRENVIDNPQTAWNILRDEIQEQIDLLKKAMEAAVEGDDTERIASLFETLSYYEDTLAKVNDVFGLALDLKEAGYAPLMRFGQYTVTVFQIDPETGQTMRDEDGKAIVEYFGKFITQAEAIAKQKAMEAEYPEEGGYRVTSGVESKTAHEMYAGVTPETVAMFGEMVGADEVTHRYYQNALTERSALKRRLQRKGTDGYSEELSRVLSNFITSNARLAAQRYYLRDVNNAIKYIPSEKGDVKDEASALKKFILDPSDAAAPVSTIMFAWYLGGSVAAAWSNMTQPLMMTFPYLSQFGGGQAAAEITKAIPYAMGKREIADSDLRDALKRASREGIVDAQEIFHLYSMGAQSASAALASALSRIPGAGKLVKEGGARARASLDAFLTLWGSMFSLAERFNRKLTFIAAWNMAVANGTRDPYAFAVLAVNETQGIYNKVNRPNWGRRAVGRTILTFKQFSIMYLEMMTRMWKHGGPEGKRATMMMLAILMLVSGEEGLPFVDDLDDLIDTIGQRLFGSDTNMKRFKRSAAHELLGKEMGDLLLYGISSKLPLDISGKLGLGNLIPGTGMLKPSDTPQRTREVAEVFGPAAGVVAQVFDAFDAMENNGVLGGAKAMAPKAVRDLAAGLEMASKGYSTDVMGRKVTDTTLLDAGLKSIGFNPTRVANVHRKSMPVQQDIGLQKKREAAIVDAWARAIVDGDDAKVNEAIAKLETWNTRNPNTPIVIKGTQIRGRVQTLLMEKEGRVMRTTPKEMRGLVADTLEDAE